MNERTWKVRKDRGRFYAICDAFEFDVLPVLFLHKSGEAITKDDTLERREECYFATYDDCKFALLTYLAASDCDWRPDHVLPEDFYA